MLRALCKSSPSSSSPSRSKRQAAQLPTQSAMPICFAVSSVLQLHRVRSSRVSTLRPSFHIPVRSTHRQNAVRIISQPRMHGGGHCHSHSHGHSHTHSILAASQSSPSALQSLLRTVTTVHETPRAAFTATALLILAAVFYIFQLPHYLPLYLAAAITAFPSLLAALLSFHPSRISVDLLMALASVTLILTSSLFEGVLLATLYSLSHASETLVHRRANRALNNLRDATPATAILLSTPTSTTHTEVKVSSVAVGDYLLVKAGQLTPCDATLVSGDAFVSTQILTGESTPIPVSTGAELSAGTRAEDSPLVIRVTRIGAESSLARIARLVTAAQENRPRVSRIFDRFGDAYARGVLLSSIALAVLLPLVTALLPMTTIPYAGKKGSLSRALGFLVTASPCALIVGAPVAYVAALSACARRGVLVKRGARALEAGVDVQRVVFDKTGTLTTGRLELVSAAKLHSSVGNGVTDRIEELGEREMGRVVGMAAALEQGAVHPVADAVQRYAEGRELGVPSVKKVKVVAGQGVTGEVEVDGSVMDARVGRASFVLGGGEKIVKEIGETTAVLRVGGEKYLLRLRDEMREEALEAVEELRKVVRVSVLTGDGRGAGEHVSRMLGGIDVVADANPEEKLQYVRSKEGILMIGDGVNDAAALAAARVGVACGLRSATAVHAADVILVREDLRMVAWLLQMAQRTRSVVVQNLVLGVGLMIVGSAGCAVFGVPLWLAVIMHEGGTVLVGLNALRLLR